MRHAARGQRVQPLGVAGEADDGRAGAGQVAAELRAQARRGAGDHGDLPGVAAAEVGRAGGERAVSPALGRVGERGQRRTELRPPPRRAPTGPPPATASSPRTRTRPAASASAGSSSPRAMARASA